MISMNVPLVFFVVDPLLSHPKIDICRFSDSFQSIVLVMDNLSTHKKKFLIEYYGEEEGD